MMSSIIDPTLSAPKSLTKSRGLIKSGWHSWAFAIVGLFSCIVICYFVYLQLPAWRNSPNSKIDLSKIVLVEATRGPLEITINGSGSLDTVNKVTLNCELQVREGKITYLIPEGSLVNKGDLVCELDNSEVNKELTEMRQQLTEAEAKFVEAQERMGMSENQTKTDNAKAKLDEKIAKLDLDKYIEGDYVQSYKKLTSEIKLKEEDFARAVENLNFTERMVKKGYMDQNDLESAYSSMKKSQVEVDAKKEELRVLVDYDKPRKIAELEHKAEESIRDRERVESKSNIALKKTVAEFESRKLGLESARQNVKFWEDQLSKCKLVAPQAGEVVYANEKARNYGDERYAIRVGNGIYSGSPVIRLPDMSLFKVDAKVIESLYSRLKIDQSAIVTIDSFPEELLTGKVIKISSVPSEDSFWNPGKKYDVEIKLDKIDKPELRLRPSMSCTFTIYSTRLENVIQIPIQAVVEIKGKTYIWVVNEQEADRREVVIGESNDTSIEIKDGLAVYEQVVLNPRTSFANEINRLEPKKKDESKIEQNPEALK